MKDKEIRNKGHIDETMYCPGREMIELAGIGKFAAVLQSMWADVDGRQSEFLLAAVTKDFIYYVDEHAPDEDTASVMLTRSMKVLSDKYLATCHFSNLIRENRGILWMSASVVSWQRRFTQSVLLTDKYDDLLRNMEVEKMTSEEQKIFLAFCDNGPEKYSESEALMAVLANRLSIQQQKVEMRMKAIWMDL